MYSLFYRQSLTIISGISTLLKIKTKKMESKGHENQGSQPNQEQQDIRLSRMELSIEKMQHSVEVMEQHLDIRGKEIDLLQVEVAKPKKWWTNPIQYHIYLGGYPFRCSYYFFDTRFLQKRN